MWIVQLVTFIEYHPYLSSIFMLIILGIIWFFWKEQTRPSYKQQKELEQLLRGLDQIEDIARKTEHQE